MSGNTSGNCDGDETHQSRFTIQRLILTPSEVSLGTDFFIRKFEDLPFESGAVVFEVPTDAIQSEPILWDDRPIKTAPEKLTIEVMNGVEDCALLFAEKVWEGRRKKIGRFLIVSNVMSQILIFNIIIFLVYIGGPLLQKVTYRKLIEMNDAKDIHLDHEGDFDNAFRDALEVLNKNENDTRYALAVNGSLFPKGLR